jgi:DNA-directed RNA polymerase specialized sigma24 family protein
MALKFSPDTKADSGRALTQSAFDMLLARLHPDRDEAGRKYDQLRRKLVKFFELWGGASPEEYADESLDRAARKIFEGDDVKNVHGFVLGVARLLNKEVVKREIRERKAIQELRRSVAEGGYHAEHEKQLACYEKCLGALRPGDRDLFVRYYQGEGRPRARQREELCVDLGVTMNLLRVRAFRIRKSVAQCIKRCLARH